jgi:hypothetical protein
MTVHWWLPEVRLWNEIYSSLIVYVLLQAMFRLMGKREAAPMPAFVFTLLPTAQPTESPR